MIRRHSLVWLSRPPVSEHSPALAESWFESGHPFMVCRTRPGEELSLGFCLPGKSGDPRSPARIAARSNLSDILQSTRPPEFHLSSAPQESSLWHWLAATAALRPTNDPKQFPAEIPHICLPPEGCTLRLTGSRMWQFLTGVQYTTETSDIDIVMDISRSGLLDQAAAFLTTANHLSPWNLDAEISVPGMGEVHWKEWLSPANPVLVKSVDSVDLRPREWFHQIPGE